MRPTTLSVGTVAPISTDVPVHAVRRNAATTPSPPRAGRMTSPEDWPRASSWRSAQVPFLRTDAWLVAAPPGSASPAILSGVERARQLPMEAGRYASALLAVVRQTRHVATLASRVRDRAWSIKGWLGYWLWTRWQSWWFVYKCGRRGHQVNLLMVSVGNGLQHRRGRSCRCGKVHVWDEPSPGGTAGTREPRHPAPDPRSGGAFADG